MQAAARALRDSLRETLRIYLPRGGGVPPPLRRQPRRGSTVVLQQNRIAVTCSARVRPNPSFKPTRYGRQRKPGLRHLVHHLSPGLRCLPPRAA
jgi:hypothetical protein